MNQCKIINLDIYWLKYLKDVVWYLRYEVQRLVKLGYCETRVLY
jgi:hypothetical protein